METFPFHKLILYFLTTACSMSINKTAMQISTETVQSVNTPRAWRVRGQK